VGLQVEREHREGRRSGIEQIRQFPSVGTEGKEPAWPNVSSSAVELQKSPRIVEEPEFSGGGVRAKRIGAHRVAIWLRKSQGKAML